MESNRAPNNQMAFKGMLLLVALVAAGAFVLARGLDDDSSEPTTTTAQPTAEATMEAEEIPDPVDTPSEDSSDATPTPAPVPEETQETTAAPEVTQPPAPDPDEVLECRNPSEIGVLVANGTDVSGAAGRLSGELNAANYVTLPPVNAGAAQTGSAFYYRAGYEVDAQCIARLLGESQKPLWPMPDPPPGGITLDTLGNAYVLVLIGPDSLAQRPG
ncbi:MAG: LytR C-terminal domain-containing protein [Acidimicrobiia bacterium]|nr:LytR C-terminal domain-containing protein [Acidimicrobiia bacterium]MCY4433242.1 LytR C-terminal domain-containing protein [bacterium]